MLSAPNDHEHRGCHVLCHFLDGGGWADSPKVTRMAFLTTLSALHLLTERQANVVQSIPSINVHACARFRSAWIVRWTDQVNIPEGNLHRNSRVSVQLLQV